MSLTDEATQEAPPVDFAEEIAAFMAQATKTPVNGMISGHGSRHTNKHGRNPYKRLEWSDIVGMVDQPQPGIDKAQAQWLIPSSLDSRVFKEQESGGSFYALWADLDKDPPALDVVAKFADAALKGADYEIYTSRSAMEDYPKSRILVPLSEPLSGADWVMAQRAFNALLEEAGIVPDPANTGPAQLCYLPNLGEFYDTRSCRDGKHFDPLKVWSDTLQKIRQSDAAAAAALKAESEAKRLHREKIRAEDVGNTGPSLIDAFNATHSVADILTGSGYEDRGNTFRHPLSVSGSFSASVKDGRVHSLSSSDPLYTEGGGVGAHDAFSAFRVLFHAGDQNTALKDAGDKWVMVGDESWNTVRRRKFAESKLGADGTLLRRVSIADVFTNPEPPHQFLWGNYIPAEALTLVSGHGGTGKSGFALQLAANLAVGREFLGFETVRSKTLFFSAEDSGGQLRNRMADLCRADNLDPVEVDAHLAVFDATDAAVLWQEDPVDRTSVPTDVYDTLGRLIDELGIRCLVVDNASDTFAANPINRSHVTRFIRALVTLIRERNGGVVLLAHIDKATAKAGANRSNSEGYADSAAWHNAARSRIFMRSEPDGRLVIEHEKSNYGPTHKPLVVGRLPTCGLKAISPFEESDIKEEQDAQESRYRYELAAMLNEFYKRGDWVSPAENAHQSHAFAKFKGEPGFKTLGLDKTTTFAIIRQLERKKLIEKEPYLKPNRHPSERWALTDEGKRLIGEISDLASAAPACASDHV